MSDYKYHISQKFASCVRLATAVDPHRNRTVQLFHLPGNFEYVGVYDGTDCWIAPAAADPFSVSVVRLLEDIRTGRQGVRPRVRIVTPQGAAQAPRKERRAVLL